MCAQQCLSLVIYGMIITFVDKQFGQHILYDIPSAYTHTHTQKQSKFTVYADNATSNIPLLFFIRQHFFCIPLL